NMTVGRVMMIVNYKKDFIKAYYTDSEVQRDITFVEEEEYLGTGGGLRLLADKVEDTFFMSNCDILIDADYADILDYHKKSGNMITMVCAQKNFEIPYGTVTLNQDQQIVEMKEKPQFDYYVNTGFYIIEPSFVERIPQNTFIHITDVIEQCIARGDRVGSYLIQDDAWMDMGQFDELEKMKQRLDNL
ncbi:MAG: nucleotidyltransferase, partial [Lachnospiraceae bacterium]|nr:nucleotidyltransferase [Lachnospiraceae bacterium]